MLENIFLCKYQIVQRTHLQQPAERNSFWPAEYWSDTHSDPRRVFARILFAKSTRRWRNCKSIGSAGQRYMCTVQRLVCEGHDAGSRKSAENSGYRIIFGMKKATPFASKEQANPNASLQFPAAVIIYGFSVKFRHNRWRIFIHEPGPKFNKSRQRMRKLSLFSPRKQNCPLFPEFLGIFTLSIYLVTKISHI